MFYKQHLGKPKFGWNIYLKVMLVFCDDGAIALKNIQYDKIQTDV